jgi:hypothetical protein
MSESPDLVDHRFAWDQARDCPVATPRRLCRDAALDSPPPEQRQRLAEQHLGLSDAAVRSADLGKGVTGIRTTLVPRRRHFGVGTLVLNPRRVTLARGEKIAGEWARLTR